MTSPIPPQDILAEKAVLGAMLIESTVIPDMAALLSPRDFYYESHQRVFEAILSLWNRQEPVDLITVSNALGGQTSAADIAAMAENALPSHSQAHARAVKETAQKRQLLKTIREAEEAIYSSQEDALSIAGQLSSTLSSLQDGDQRGFIPLTTAITGALKVIEKAQERKDPVVGIPTGLRDLDFRIGGIFPGELWLIAGRPSMGKTALAVSMALGASDRGYGVCFVSAESPNNKLALRMLARKPGLENRNLRRGQVSDIELTHIIEGAGKLRDLPFWLLDRERSWDRIKARIRGMKLREQKLVLVVIDYVGLLSAPVPKGERYLEIGRISSEAKGLAIELDLGILLLSQLNREVEARTSKKPKLSDLRESGCLEQDADVVGLLYRDAYYNEKAPHRDLAELEIAKNRDGATGIIKLRFREATTSFHDWVEPSPVREFCEASDGINQASA